MRQQRCERGGACVERAGNNHVFSYGRNGGDGTVSSLELIGCQGASPEAVLITNLSLGINDLILNTAFGTASAGAGFAVGFIWLVGQSL